MTEAQSSTVTFGWREATKDNTSFLALSSAMRLW